LHASRLLPAISSKPFIRGDDEKLTQFCQYAARWLTISAGMQGISKTMSNSFAKAGVAVFLAAQGSFSALAAPGDRIAAANTGAANSRPVQKPTPPTRPTGQASTGAATFNTARPGTAGTPSAPKPYTQPKTTASGTTYAGNRPPVSTNANTKPNYNYNNGRPTGGNNNITAGNTVVVAGGNRNPNAYPVYRTPNGSYYRPPNGGYYRPPPPPVGGWGGGYYPPPRYYYDDGPSVGEVIAGVAVAGSLLYVLSEATKPKQQTVVVQGAPPPMPPAPQPYVPPKNSTGAPAKISVDFAGLAPEARPSASVCIAEASRQIGATGGTEIRIDRIVDVEPGNGGYRFRVNLIGVYPDEARTIPMYCRATPEKIVELTFG
jgi:hypothetical protein